MSKKIKVGTKAIAEDQPCFIIAEAGSNHNQDLDRAKELIDVAAEAGVDAVKFQTFTADKIAAKTEDEVMKLGDEYDTADHLYELYQDLELPREWQTELRGYAREKGLIFLSTPFDYEAVDQLDELGMPAFKIASFECIDLPFLKYIAKKDKPIILSTGMANLGEIEEALEAIYQTGNEQVVVLHCGINYPMPMEDVNLAAMDTIKQAFQVSVGYSDHTLGINVPIAAVARGAKVIEKHYTLDRDLAGPDHKFALEPDELKEMVTGIREIESAIGSPIKKHVESEEVHYQRGRRSIFAIKDIKEGTKITEDMVKILRPGIGLKPKYYDLVIGREAQQDIEANEPITWEKI
ncbi:N-acetylneuraminate synthase/pseudaminic acid synthase [Halobacteroides halobius DSM 5150]|uniref:N-acetylneuraminate synthase/pseudaminic acid synthase n=1 Tax=Halobacteroides halobius (strain ATCC 35273 / DSM 5150 / MD-1) TaxID=748449 RepID=L0KDE7_HALHC|nr:N-acetylneuraminate synthase [Halobacteroides halobius]AGB42118.1 N-acetylneuraminate synthase/pseudaminic acid synthase [Halobacteroides halobius DSM 5150]